jgi:cytochrome P450
MADDTLPGGTNVQLGDKIYLSPYTMHRHPAWYPEPDRFDPERFADEAVRSRPRFAFYPFGGGARQCIGEPFARLEITLVLAAILRRFRLEPASPLPVPLRPSIVLEPRGGLPIRLSDPPSAPLCGGLEPRR